MPGGGYRYHRDPSLGPGYETAMDALFGTYSDALPVLRAWVETTFAPSPGESPAARARAVNAKALDLLRGLLPAASLSHMGIYASGQAYEQLILHLLGHPLPEARAYGSMILDAVKAIMPSFVARVERPERGGDGSASSRTGAPRGSAGRPGSASTAIKPRTIGHRFGCSTSTATRTSCSRRCSSRPRPRTSPTTLEAVGALDPQKRAQLLGDLVGERANRRHRPGRGFEALRYRFEIVSDYGAFRDLQRHRMLTVQWQNLSPELGAAVPEEVITAGAGDAYARALDISRAEYERLVETGHAAAAPYALCLGYRIRYVLDLNAREAMHLIELRSGREGHPSYRAVAHEMHAQIAARHPAVAATMVHVDEETEPRLERILSEMRTEARLLR
jgi:thymidylate synthase ThyX